MPSFKPKDPWEAAPHTLAKIEIVRRYLSRWFFILGSKHRRLVYIDGFAGPGYYTNSTESSPMAALLAAKEAVDQSHGELNNVEFNFLFVEKKKEFVDKLESVISATSWPANFKWEIEQGSFEEKVGGLLGDVKQKNHQLSPTFAFVDPFGATGLPFQVISDILSHKSCEVLLNLDSDGIGRLITAQEFEKNQQNLDALFGDRSWKQLDTSLSLPKLAAAVLTLYKQRLRSLRDVRYVFAFAMNTSQGLINYHLVFASQHPLGLEKMKEAMKAVDKTGSYSFSDDSVGQPLLFNFDDPSDWADKMQSALAGASHPYEKFRDFALNETPFINPKSMLEHLKQAGKVQVSWRGEPSKRGFPEEKIQSILITK